jgi:hypothetical protein
MAGLLDFLGDSNSSNPTSGAGSSPGGGLMGLMTNPQTAGLFGLFNGMLASSGPSRIPVNFGQTLASGMQGATQGAENSLALQRQLMQMRAMQGLMGGGAGQQQPQQPAQPDPTLAQGAPVSGGANTGPLSGLSAGLGGAAPQMPPAAQAQAPGAGGAGTIYDRTPQQLFQQGMLMNMAGIQGGGDLMRVAVEHDPTLAMQMPTDVQKNAAAAYGYGTPGYTNALQGTVDKGTITSLRPGAPYVRGNQIYGTPPNAPAGFMNQPNPDGSWSLVPVSGGLQAVGSSAAAAEGGKGSVLPYAGVDAQGNPLPVTNRTSAATQSNGALPLPLRNNNPGALSPGGSVAQFPTLQAGLQANDANLAGYANDPNVKTIGDAITKWVGSPPNAPAYIKDVTQRLGVPASTSVDLTNPVQRQALLTAITLHENGPSSVFGAAQPQSAGAAPAAAQGGPIYASAPMGATNAANASQAAPSKQMADAYGALSGGDSNYQASRAALQTMLGIAQNQSAGDTVARLLPSEVATKVSNDAAEYEKAHANFVSLQGKALGGGGTDASRATLDAAVPTFDKPQDAKVQGLTNQLQQLDLSHIKTQFLTPLYQQGDEKAFTRQSAAFDNNVTPQMTPVLTMPAGPQRAQALQQMIQANPAIKPKLDWAVQNGILQ